jgi:glycerol-3-phosphate acyltransferase PlsY
MEWATLALLVLIGYLSGSVPFSYLVGRTQGIDLRKVGSGNTGASNVWRACGFKFFVIALLLDIIKGFIPTALAFRIVGVSPIATIIVGLAAMAGHVFPVFMRFRGGKAVATMGGVLLAVQPVLLIMSAVIWTVIYRLSGYPSVASLLGMVILALSATGMSFANRLDPVFSGFIWASLIVFVYLHRSNIARLTRGTENKIRPKTQ